ncbi:MAG TPA: helix-turn-helix domain-containing protein [Acholeplasmataceae bacterium]|jgi:transcriptional regulator with XRE-family HTH domain|nr:helix-turn-helix domain-containing protein [Acholeplasmataceae bacterium]
MNFNFGENLKLLRRQKDLTQEEVAEILNVSTQTISRWETNMGYPDIELLPAIANFYSVTIDSLFGMDINRKNEKISQIIKDILAVRTKGEVKKAIKMCEEALKEFPNDYRLLAQLASCLLNHGNTEEEKKENAKRLIEICEKILKECADTELRHSATLLLCHTYPDFNKKEKAREMAESMPSYSITSNQLLLGILEGEEKKHYVQGNLFTFIQLIAVNVRHLLSLEEVCDTKIGIINSVIKIVESFYDQNDYYFHHYTLHLFYRNLAAIYADRKNESKTLEYIEKASFHAISYDTRPEQFIHTSSLFKGYKDTIYNSITNSTCNQSCILLDRLHDKRYDFIKNNKTYIDITEKLKVIAKE